MAKIVSSLPTHPLLPGLFCVPRCRTRILPARTNSPPYFFTPSRCPWLSRPLRTEPPPFLCAISYLLFLGDRIDANLCIFLPVPCLGSDALFSHIFKNHNLRTLYMGYNCSLYFCTLYEWGSNFYGF